MKKIIALISLSTLCLCVSVAKAQQQPPPAVSFIGTVQSYFTSFNTNLDTFQTERAELWTGVDQGHDTLAAVLGLTVNVGKKFNVEAVFRNANVAGTLQSGQGGVGYSIVKYDTKFTAGLGLGYRFDDKRGYVSPFLDVRKALTENTYAGLRLYYEQRFSGDKTAHAPGLFVITGFKF